MSVIGRTIRKDRHEQCKVWLITGASSGFGKALAEAVIANGDCVAITSRRLDRLQAIAHGHEDRVLPLALGADGLLDTSDDQALAAASNGFDLIIDTVPVKHDINPYVPLLDIDATLVLVGQLGPMDELFTVPAIMGRRRIAGLMIGGIPETQEMLEFCARMNIHPDCEMIRMDQINEAFERIERSDVRYRFVIDMARLAEQAD